MDVSSRVMIPLVTPFNRDYSLDIESFKLHVERLYNSGVRYFFPSSSTGEMDRLGIEEVAQLVNVLRECLGDIHIYPGIFSHGVSEALSKIEYLDKSCDVDGYIIPTPSYFKYGLNSLYKFYSEILANTEKEVIIYVIPSNTGILPEPQLFRMLRERYSNLAGVKITYNDITYLRDVLDITYDGFKVYVGSDLLSLPNLMLGGYGVIPGLGNIFPKLYIEMYRKFYGSRYGDAINLYRLLAKITNIFKIPYMFPAVIKYTLEALDLGIKRFVRPPMEEVDDRYRDEILDVVNIYGGYI
ncbi:MAG TPA: dihydrodipicolinate synthase family protein [Thermoprotei archaeon]|nr:dihydrodipicolinate synthase family protein [Thermoprotei archaeon]